MNFLAGPILHKPWVEVKGKLKFEERVGVGRSWGSGGWEAGVEQLSRPRQDAEGEGDAGRLEVARACPGIRASAHPAGGHCPSLCPGPGATSGHREHLAEKFSL